jgi:HD domain
VVDVRPLPCELAAVHLRRDADAEGALVRHLDALKLDGEPTTLPYARNGCRRYARVVNADALSASAAARSALEALRAAAGTDSPLERHCLRQFAIAERLAGDRVFDREVLLCACWLHDLGLSTLSHDPYVTEGARLAARVLEPFGWPPERLQRCMDACEQHHAPRSRIALGLEVELVRQSDLVDVTAGLVNFGLDRRWLRELFREVPRDGLWRLIGSAVLNELRHRPASLVGVFLSPRRTRP